MQDKEKMGDSYLHTYARLNLTLKKLQDERPSPLFVETSLFDWTGPSYDNSHSGLKQLLVYLHEHYQYQAQGQYLTALKLK